MSANRYSQLFDRLVINAPFSSGAEDQLAEDCIDLVSGVPDPTLLPRDWFCEAMDKVMRSDLGDTALDYSAYGGTHELRSLVARWRGVPEDNVLITNGAMNGIYLSTFASINPGDVIVTEDPTFPFALRIFDLAGAHISTVPLTNEGLDLEALEALLRSPKGKQVKALYTIPDFQNPSGVCLDGGAKRRLMELSERYGFTVIADSPYDSLWFDTQPASFPQEYRTADDGSGLVEIGSFSKLFGPGWRIGWLIADRERVRKLEGFRARIDSHSNGVGQMIIASVLQDESRFHQLLDTQRATYRKRAGILYEALTEVLGSTVRARRPEGGYFLWGRFEDGWNPASAAAAGALARNGVSLVAGDAFRPDHKGCGEFRLCFSHVPIESLREGAVRIARAHAERE